MRNTLLKTLLTVGLWLGAGFATDQPPLDSAATFVVDSIEYHILNAFDDSRKAGWVDDAILSNLNRLHFKTRPSVIAQHLFFAVGDTINMHDFAESERWLRRQIYLADAHISLQRGAQGENIVRVQSSDKWTTVVPIAINKPGDKWLWQLGLLENNFLGWGKSVGIYYGRGEEHETWMANYADASFLQNHNQLDLSYIWNADGYMGEFMLARPFLQSYKNEWAYTIAGEVRHLPRKIYWSDATWPVAKVYIPAQDLQLVNKAGDSVAFPTFKPGEQANNIFSWHQSRRDSLTLRLAKSWGGARVAKVRTGFDYQKNSAEIPTLHRTIFREGEDYFTVDSSALRSLFLPWRQDVRWGFGIEFSRLVHTKRHNFHHIKWTEDVPQGWVLATYIAKNYRALGAANNHWYGEADGQISLGNAHHYFFARAQQSAYWQFGSSALGESEGKLKLEYLFKPTLRHGTAWSATYTGKNHTNWAEPYYLGSTYGLEGFPAFFLAGNHLWYSSLEQRWYPDIEFGTMLPVLVGFVNAGQVAPSRAQLWDRNPQWSAGFSLRIAMSKSVDGLINHFNLVWPLNGPWAGSPWPMLAVLASVSM